MTTFLADFLGKLSGIFCFSVLFNFLFRKITLKDTSKQKCLATFIATVIYIIIPTYITRTIESTNDLIAWALISIFCGVVVIFFHLFKIQLRYFLLSEIYAIIIFMTLGFPIIFVLNLIQAYSSNVGTGFFISSFLICSILVFNQKLPGVRSKS